MNRNAFSAAGILALSLALSPGAFAQIPPTLPGSQIQQIPPPPVPQRADPEIRIERGAPPAIPAEDKVRVLVQSLRVTGQTVYSEAELVAIRNAAEPISCACSGALMRTLPLSSGGSCPSSTR